MNGPAFGAISSTEAGGPNRALGLFVQHPFYFVQKVSKRNLVPSRLCVSTVRIQIAPVY